MVIFNLALDRIVSFEPVDIPYRINPEFDADTFFDNVIGVTKNLGSKPRKIKFMANATQTSYIRTKPLHPSQRYLGSNPVDGSSTFEIEVIVNFELYSTFLSYGAGIKIISPRDVVAHMRKRLDAAAKLYD